MPPPAPRGPDAAIVQRRGETAQISDARRAQRLDDRQNVGGEGRGFLDLSLPPDRRCLGRIAPVPELSALGLPLCERRTRPLRDQPPFLLRESSVEVQHERVCIRTQFDDDERHLLRHETGDEGNVPGEPVELGNDDRSPAGLPRRECRSELRAPVQGVGTLAGLDLGELCDECSSSAPMRQIQQIE